MNVFIRSLIFIGELTTTLVVMPFVAFVSFARFIVSTIAGQHKEKTKTASSQNAPTHEDIPVYRSSHSEEAGMRKKITEQSTKERSSIGLFSLYLRNLRKVLMSYFRAVIAHISSSFKMYGKKSHGVVKQSGNYLSQSTTRITRPTEHGITKFFNSIYSFFVFIFRVVYLSFVTNFKFFYIGFLTCLLIIFGFQSYDFVKKLPSPESIGELNFPLSSHVFDRNGKLLYEIYSKENRTPVSLDNLPSYVPQATIAIEDKDFFKHNGISPISGVLRAIKDTYQTKELQGGSTITQQLVKSALLSPERTIERKLKEMVLAVWAERLYTKQEILEMYLNQVPYGGASYGIEEAAQTFFGKNATELTLGEAALLAGLPRAPSIYSPYINPQLAQRRRDQVLRNMYEQGYITEEQKNTEQQKPITVIPPRINIKAPHFVFYVKSELEKEYGIKQVEEGGFRVNTTLDLEIQEQTQKIVQEELKKIRHLNVNNAAVLITKPSTGEIITMVGSHDYFATPAGSFNVTTALRQPGSTIKPIMYSLALQSGGYTAATMINDSKVVYKNPGSPPYIPVNYDNKYRGNVTLRFSLSNSLNIPAVKTLDSIGVENFANHAKTMGIDTWNDPSRFGLSLTLGGVETTMMDMSEAFGVFANQGERVDLKHVLSIHNSNKEKMYVPETTRIKALNEGVAYIITTILSDNKTRETAFGPNSALVIPDHTVAVKTGTTNDLKDNWTIGFTQDYLVATWVGNNDNTPMNQYLVSGITGAAPIWNRVMTYLVEKKAENPTALYPMPDNVIEKECYGKNEYFLRGTETTVSCSRSAIKKPPEEEKKD